MPARSQFYLIPRSQQAYKYVQMAISIVVDLGLDQDCETVRRQRPDIVMRQDDFRTRKNGSMQVSVEAQRAALGCSYISSV